MGRSLFLLVWERDRLTIHCLLLGLLFYEICNFIFPFFPLFLVKFIQLLSIASVIYSYIKLTKQYADRKKYIKFFWFFLFWSLIAVLRLQRTDYTELQLILFQPIHVLAYLIPITFILPSNKPFLRAIFKYSIALIFLLFAFFIMISLVLFKESNVADLLISAFGSGAIFLFFTWHYHKTWIRYLSVAAIFLSAYVGAVNGRRNIILISLFSLILGSISIVFHSPKYNLAKRYFLILLVVLGSLVGYLSVDISKISHFSALSERLNTDSRTDVITAFVNDFNDVDWILGRGVDGAYYNPIKYWNFQTNESRDVTYRDTIENGYLFIILKMGLIGLLLFLILVVVSIYKGLLKSNNVLAKAGALYLVTYLVEMISFGQPAFSYKYFFVWVSISICLSSHTRLMSERAMKKIFR